MRKKMIKNPSVLQKRIDAYFDSLSPHVLTDIDGNIIYDKSGRPSMSAEVPATVCGLCRACGFKAKQTLYNYRKDEDYKDIIDAALMRIEEYAERRLYDRDGARGAEFSLTYNFKWGQQERQSDGGGVVMLSDIKKEDI